MPFIMFLRQKPKLQYCGLTIVLSNPSRFDIEYGKILSGEAGRLVNRFLQPEFNTMQCDIREADDPSPLMEGTKALLLLGTYAMHQYCPGQTIDNALQEMRGSPLTTDKLKLPAIASFFPQDCVDIKSYEKVFNTESKDYQSNESSGEEDETGDVKRYSNTKRGNFGFWLQSDIRKVKQIILKRIPSYKEPTYVIWPSADIVINELQSNKGKFLYFDKETDVPTLNMQCFSFSFDSQNIYCVPTLDHNYKPAYSSLHHIMRALAIAIRDNTIVAHNGAEFDFFNLGYKYNIPINKAYDTRIAMHRCFPEVETSLGHCVSYWTWEIFHKDSNPESYYTPEQVKEKLLYCGKDVYTMCLVHQEIQRFAKTIPGLEYSIECAMRSIRPYLTTTLQGIRYNEHTRQARIKENDKLMVQYLRMIEILIGGDGMVEVQSAVKGKAGCLPNSNKQCVKYFHDMLEYEKVAYNPPNDQGMRSPSLAKKAMYKLRLKHDNPVIDLCNLYRTTRLETTTPLGFSPWKDDNDKIITTTEH